MVALEDIINDNYLHTNEECADLAVEYIKKHKTIYHKPIIFIKGITKITTNILAKSPEKLYGLLEKVFTFHMEGVNKIRNGDSDINDDAINKKLESHLLAHASTIALAIYDSNNDLKWLEMSFYGNLTAADRAEHVDISHCASSLVVASSAARVIYKKIGDPTWLDQGSKIANVAEEFESILSPASLTSLYHSISAFSFEYYELYGKFDLDGGFKYLERAYNYALKSSDFAKNSDHRTLGNCYSHASKAAWLLYRLTKDVTCLENVYKHGIKAACLLEDTNSNMVLINYSNSGRAAEEIFNITREIDWGEKAYQCLKEAAHLAVAAKSPQANPLYADAGNCARDIYMMNRDDKYAKLAIESYNKIIKRRNSSPQNFVTAIGYEIKKLENYIITDQL